MSATQSNNLKLAIRAAADASAAATTVRTQIGADWVMSVYRAIDEEAVATGTASGSLGGTGATITGSVSVTFSAACNPGETAHYARIEKADGSVWIRGALGLPGSSAPFILSGAVIAGAVTAVSFTGTVNDGAIPLDEYTFGINCGGPAYTASNDTEYLADAHASGGQSSAVASAIAGTDDAALYQTDRWGALTYSIPVTPAKNYRVRLHFAETWDLIAAPNQRVFGYIIQPGTPQAVTVTGIDLFALRGLNSAYITDPVDVLVTGSTLTIQLTAQNQNPKICAIEVKALDGGDYVPVAQDSVAWIQGFRQGGHDAHLGLMPSGFSWSDTGRDHAIDYITRRSSDTRVVPWFTIFAAGNGIWPQTVGVEVGETVLRGKRAADGVWETVRTWDTYSDYKHNRDTYASDAPHESYGTAPTGADTQRTSNAGTKIVKRANNSNFPERGTHIHGWYEDSGGRVPINRSGYIKLQLRCRMRAVGWPSADGLAPITNPPYDNTSIVACLSCDTYSADGNYNLTWGGDLGIANAKFVTNEWQTFYWYAHLASAVTSDDIPS